MINDREEEEVTQKQLDQLVEDASYLQDEAEALKYVIDEVPYTESPPEGESIAEMLLLIDHAQLTYFRPVIEDTFENPRPTRLENFDHFESTFELDGDKAKDIQRVLSKIVKHRAGLVNLIKKIPLIDWEKKVYSDSRELYLYDFAQGMIRFERTKLKDIADLVMVLKQEEQNQREIKKRREQHNHPGNEDNPTDN